MILYSTSLRLFACAHLLFHCFLQFAESRKARMETFQTDILMANRFESPSLDFLGNEIANAALTNATINGHLHHLAVDSIEVKSERSDRSGGTRMAAIDHRGSLMAIQGIKWDPSNGALQISSLSLSDYASSSSKTNAISVYSDLDLQSNVLRNFRLEEHSIVRNLILDGGAIRNVQISNVTFDNLALGSIAVDSLVIGGSVGADRSASDSGSDFNSSIQKEDGAGNKIKFLVIGNDGAVKSSNAITEESDSIQINTKVTLKDAVDFDGNNLSNVHITSGTIEGNEFDVKARNVQVDKLILSPYLKSKRHFTDSLVKVDADGVLRSADLNIEEGWIENAKFTGDVQFRNTGEDKQGKIIDAIIEGGNINDLEHLTVLGEAHCKNGLKVQEDAYIEGSLIVGGSVLGSGPYVDVSDERFKMNIEEMSEGDEILTKIHQLRAVSYDLDPDVMLQEEEKLSRSMNGNQKQFGFIAQDVLQVFPELVTERPDGYLGIQYARFIPLMVEALKDVDDRVRKMEEENEFLRNTVKRLLERIE